MSCIPERVYWIWLLTMSRCQIRTVSLVKGVRDYDRIQLKTFQIFIGFLKVISEAGESRWKVRTVSPLHAMHSNILGLDGLCPIGTDIIWHDP